VPLAYRTVAFLNSGIYEFIRNLHRKSCWINYSNITHLRFRIDIKFS